jgi:hypothetical protein
MDYITTHGSLSPIRREFAPGFVKYKKGCTRPAAASDKVYQLLIKMIEYSERRGKYKQTSKNKKIEKHW